MAKRRSRKPAVAQNEVLARTLASQSKSQIAREMGIDRQTVTRIQECHNLPQLLSDSRQYVVERVVPDAVQSAHAQILDQNIVHRGWQIGIAKVYVGSRATNGHAQTRL